MPTYEYECSACDHRFEEYQSITARPIRTCPECGKRQVTRLLGTGAGVIFRGSGFYETDYRSDSYKKAAKAEKDSTTAKDGKAAKSSDGAAASKSDGGRSAGKSSGSSSSTGTDND